MTKKNKVVVSGRKIHLGLCRRQLEELKESQQILYERDGERYPLSAIIIDAIRKFSKPKVVKQFIKEAKERSKGVKNDKKYRKE